MGYMKEVAILIQEARMVGITLELGDFRTIDGELTIDGMPASQWIDAMGDGGAEKHYGKDGE